MIRKINPSKVAERMISKNQWLVFDVDGTLTESRQLMDPSFKGWFMDNVPMNRVALLTGSDKGKTVEQVGQDFWESCGWSLQCCGNEVWRMGTLADRSAWEPSKDLLEFLGEELGKTPYEYDYGRNIEVRTGMLNFSVVGRNAVGEQRERYFKYDCESGERLQIARRLMDEFQDLEASIGGETGIDIFPRGKDKSQAVDILGENLVFFGDNCGENGNDYPIFKKIDDDNSNRNSAAFKVLGPGDTFHYLEILLSFWS